MQKRHVFHDVWMVNGAHLTTRAGQSNRQEECATAQFQDLYVGRLIDLLGNRSHAESAPRFMAMVQWHKDTTSNIFRQVQAEMKIATSPDFSCLCSYLISYTAKTYNICCFIPLIFSTSDRTTYHRLPQVATRELWAITASRTHKRQQAPQSLSP